MREDEIRRAVAITAQRDATYRRQATQAASSGATEFLMYLIQSALENLGRGLVNVAEQTVRSIADWISTDWDD